MGYANFISSSFRRCPACLHIDRTVTGLTSPLCLGTVTRPGLVGCTYWQWLPRLPGQLPPQSPAQTISSIETGQFNPTAKLALILCVALDKKFEELFYFDE